MTTKTVTTEGCKYPSNVFGFDVSKEGTSETIYLVIDYDREKGASYFFTQHTNKNSNIIVSLKDMKIIHTAMQRVERLMELFDDFEFEIT